MNSNSSNIQFLAEPILVTDQEWPSGTTPLVSVSSLVYNHLPYLETCIEHLLQQKTSFPVEFIFHDDASNDGSTAIIQQYCALYPKLFKLVLQKQNNYHHNIRKIENDLHQARSGKYIANCEGDDYWIDPLKLEKQVQFLESNPNFAGVHTRVQYVNASGEFCGVSNKVTPQLEEADFKDIILNSMIHSVSFMYRASVLLINNTPIWELSNHYYDQYLFLVTAREGKIKYLNETTAAYRINVGVLNTWNRFSKALYTEECIHFFQCHITRSDWRLATFLKLKSVNAILYCCYAKSHDALASVYLKKYIRNLKSIYNELPFFQFLKVASSVEYNMVRGLFWHAVLYLSRGRIKPKGIT